MNYFTLPLRVQDRGVRVKVVRAVGGLSALLAAGRHGYEPALGSKLEFDMLHYPRTRRLSTGRERPVPRRAHRRHVPRIA